MRHHLSPVSGLTTVGLNTRPSRELNPVKRCENSKTDVGESDDFKVTTPEDSGLLAPSANEGLPDAEFERDFDSSFKPGVEASSATERALTLSALSPEASNVEELDADGIFMEDDVEVEEEDEAGSSSILD